MDAPFVSPSGEKMHSLVVTVYVPEPLFASACEAVDDKSGGNLSMGDVLAEHIANAFSEEGRTMEGVYDSTMDVIRISLHKRGGANGS